MWPFSRKVTLSDSGIFSGFTEWHCHLLPGVDDGVRTMEETLQLLSEYERLGVREVWFTPHVMEDIPNTTCGLRERFAQVKSAYHGGMSLHLSAEYMLDRLFVERLVHDDLLPLGRDGRQLLVETSYFNPPMDLQGTLERIKGKGFYPVLAHPERYMYMDRDDYRSLRSLGVRLQLNIFSLAGFYGRTAVSKAVWLLEHGMYSLCGSDTHSFRQFERMLGSEMPRRVADKCSIYPFRK